MTIPIDDKKYGIEKQKRRGELSTRTLATGGARLASHCQRINKRKKNVKILNK
jgi:hypothetical protein